LISTTFCRVMSQKLQSKKLNKWTMLIMLSRKRLFFLQVGAFQTEQEADNLKAKLALLGIEAIVQSTPIQDKGVLHRVRVGPFVDMVQVNKAKANLAENGFKADLIKVNNP